MHLKAVVVMETQRFMPDYPSVQFEARLFQAFLRTRVARVENRHVVFLCQCVDCTKQAQEVLLRVDILLAVCRQQQVSALLQPQPSVDVRSLDLLQIRMQHLRHRGAGNIGPLLREPVFGKVASCMFRVTHVDVRNDVHDPAVGLLRKAFVLTAVTGLHMENRNMEPLGGNGR